MQAASHGLDDVNGTQGSSHHQGSVSPARAPPARPACLVHPYGTGSSLTVTKSAKGAIFLKGEPLDGHVEQGPEQRP